MEMSLKQSTLVLLTVAVAVMVISAQVTISLDEKEKRQEVPFGSNLTLFCNLRVEEQGRFWVFLCFNRSEPRFNNVTEELASKVLNKSTNTSTGASIKTKQDLKEDTEETLLKYFLPNVTHNNSGWYFCMIQKVIPNLGEKIVRNAVEVVIVMNEMEHTTYKSQVTVSPIESIDKWWMWIVLGVSIVVLIVLLIICVLMTRRLRGRRASECPVYANMRPTPSPRPGMPAANLKTVSSSPNLRTPSPSGRYEESKRKRKQ
ncbi:uncharacterized protein LOC121900196 [Thunnus maccoyii]|uniref:uncharacterized protein LOC121900196 n=1 Tax=Thunnus maccoyii TaxID=8240 RepID=UPI001C4D2134|nr:uncharacterized protein LOC121900196 [Thunnus maccoyii]XP_042272194.1 uncharacterized protein LOC121900196 [Thunnus maccoyii]XP_042272195.1 uncharacterized protein LOC121900196 [Thunnus maccoyii]XP_042272196.1 uncharacterized protein LOC121900196 [Thunnus maccoyii]XP_042272197.1 uncharacterized protein LOC121900196 [Thunnus maccoyii]XP_042272198.1 uncharacterized protein LOC121900196 [Thunnus maccoyii]XP_042272199.1 uncharacterized protein LOC121900196 [Thunnus maccoyii]XP_042272200.1 unc